MYNNKEPLNKKRIERCILSIGFLCHFLVSLLRILKFLKIQFIKVFLYLVISFGFLSYVSAEEFKAENSTLDTILDTLTNLTCETQGVGNLLRTEFSHTCIPAPFFTFVIANIISPGLYANTFLRVYINDKELFPRTCTRGNRIDYYDQKLSFSLCSNTKLAAARVGAVAKSAVVIAKAVFTGKDPWDDIVDAWNIPKSDYHNIYKDKREGDSDTMFDIGLIPVLPWKVIKEKDKMCVATQSFAGWIPIGCKYIKEPFPVSIYADFLDLTPEGRGALEKLTSLTTCGNMGGCYKRAHEHSRASIVMTGPLIECVREMIAKLMISSAVCSFDDVKNVLGSNSRVTSALYQFQKNMHRAVTAMLTLYVIIFGFRIVLSGNVPEKVELINFGVKFLFVTYFAVGININPGSGNDLDRMDGMIQWAFPFLLDGMNQLASWIINASPSQLCKFNDVYYPDSLRHMQLWDSLDCRISHYLGLDAIQTMIVENASRSHDFSRLDILSFPIPPYIYLLVPAVISGNWTLISLAIMYPLLIISVGAFIVNATVVCMISIVILGVLAPLFVPMYLFNYTKGYFESWVKLLISFMLQPMVAVTFMTTMLAVFDFGFYGTCKYAKKDFTYSGAGFAVGDTNLANFVSPISDGRAVRYFYVDQNWQDSYTKEEAENCRDSLGFILNNPFQFVFDLGKDVLTNDSMPWIEDTTGEEEKKRFDFLGAIQPSAGMFFGMVEVVFEKIKKLAIAMLTACLVLYLMYHFSESLAEFAADMTEGVSLSNMSIKPQSLFKAGMAATAAAGGIAGGVGDKMLQGAGKLKDKLSGDKKGAEDKSSTEGEKDAVDSVSTEGGDVAVDSVSTGADAAGSGAGGAAGSAAGSAAGTAASQAAKQAVKQVAKQAVEHVKGTVKEVAKEAINSVKETAEGTVKDVHDSSGIEGQKSKDDKKDN